MRPLIIMCMLSYPARYMLCGSVDPMGASAGDGEVSVVRESEVGCVQFASTVKLFVGVWMSSVGS